MTEKDILVEVLAAKVNYEACKALTPTWAWRESAADTILNMLFDRVLGKSESSPDTGKA